jgi:hypothetical protein
MTMTHEQFMADLLKQWKSRKEQYAFAGFEGDEYNAWLEHRHGWPITEDGTCAPSLALSLDDGGEANRASDCSVCVQLQAMYQGATMPQDKDEDPVQTVIWRNGDGSVAIHFQQGTANIDYPLNVVLSKEQNEEFSRVYGEFLRRDAVATSKKLVAEVRKGLKQWWTEG